MSDDSDPALLERYRNGDRGAFSVLVARYHRPLYNAAYRILGDAEDAKDITQVVFLKVAQQPDGYDPRYKFFSWIYRIAVNESLNLLRHDGRMERLEEEADLPGAEEAEPDRRAEAAELSERIQRALMGMTTEHRTVIALRHFSDCSYREIAVILDLDEKTVKSRLHEARHRLAGLLGDPGAR